MLAKKVETQRTKAEALKEITHRLRGPIGLLKGLRRDAHLLPEDAQQVLEITINRLTTLVRDCSDECSQATPKGAP